MLLGMALEQQTGLRKGIEAAAQRKTTKEWNKTQYKAETIELKKVNRLCERLFIRNLDSAVGTSVQFHRFLVGSYERIEHEKAKFCACSVCDYGRCSTYHSFR
jgi:hypothetical protein